jgi:hypothetical protein
MQTYGGQECLYIHMLIPGVRWRPVASVNSWLFCPKDTASVTNGEEAVCVWVLEQRKSFAPPENRIPF